ncbi:MAG TPA: YceI family protein [Bacteroidia bacterium]|nr:YceI family protein [Bacteroidia bacterium]HNB33600.1 YceI family protein [Bacteroidia bacterium]
MKKLFLSAIAVIMAFSLNAQTKWTADKSHSKIGFTVTHMLIAEVEGHFKDFTASMTASKDNFEDSKVEFKAPVSSINTNDDKRDEHLRGSDFFDMANHPEISFTSVTFKPAGDKKFKVVGNLTMRGVTRSVTLEATHMGTVEDPWGNTKAGFKLTGKVNRKDFGIAWNKTLTSGGAVVSDEVAMNCMIELIKQK